MEYWKKAKKLVEEINFLQELVNRNNESNIGLELVPTNKTSMHNPYNVAFFKFIKWRNFDEKRIDEIADMLKALDEARSLLTHETELNEKTYRKYITLREDWENILEIDLDDWLPYYLGSSHLTKKWRTFLKERS